MILFLLARDSATPQDSETTSESLDARKVPNLRRILASLTISVTLSVLGEAITTRLPFRIGTIPIITLLSVTIASLFPRQSSGLSGSSSVLGALLMQLFFAATGASGSIRLVVQSAPAIILFSVVQLVVHLMLLLGLGKAFRVKRKLLLLASNSNVGGPTTAAGMATALGWTKLIVPALLSGVFGYSIGTFLGLGLGSVVLTRVKPLV